MSIQTEITRIKNSVDAAYDAVQALGGTIPQDLTVANLLAAIASIKGISTIAPSANYGSIQAQISRIAADIASAYQLCDDSGATLPSSLVAGNLASCISTIPIATYDDWPGWNNATWEDINNLCYAKQIGLISRWPDDIAVGATRTETLTTTVLGTTTHEVMIIGIDHDAEGTLTFQTKNGLATETAFSSKEGSSDPEATKWSDSDCLARQYCVDYYNAFTGKNYIRQVTKVTNLNNDKTSTNMGTTNDYVWIPSYDEVGLGSYQYAPAGDEFTQNGPKQAAYAYYTDANSRIKKQGDGGNAIYWWLRSRNTGAYRVGCITYAGTAYYHIYYYTDCLAPCFVIGNPSAQTIE